MKDMEALKKFMWGNGFMIDGMGYEARQDNDSLPVTRIKCKNNLCNEQQVVAVQKCFYEVATGLVVRKL